MTIDIGHSMISENSDLPHPRFLQRLFDTAVFLCPGPTNHTARNEKGMILSRGISPPISSIVLQRPFGIHSPPRNLVAQILQDGDDPSVKVSSRIGKGYRFRDPVFSTGTIEFLDLPTDFSSPESQQIGMTHSVAPYLETLRL